MSSFEDDIIPIPREFQPRRKSEEEENEESRDLLQSLFSSASSDDDKSTNYTQDEYGDDSVIENTTIGPFTFRLKCPPDKGTLFAHKVWSGSKYLSSYIIENQADLLKLKGIQNSRSFSSSEISLNSDSRVVEFGAGTGLSSLLCIALGCSFCVVSDYPDEDVLRSLRETIGLNWYTLTHARQKPQEKKGRSDSVCDIPEVHVKGYEWGKEAHCLWSSSSSIKNQETDGISDADKFDVAILSECLWMHKEHESLAYSVYQSLKGNGRGIAIITYAHHIPGKEEEDDNFFVLCREKYGMIVEHEEMRNMPYMWDETKSIVVHLKVIRKP